MALPRQCSTTLWKNTSTDGRYGVPAGSGVPAALAGETLALEGLILPTRGNTRLNLTITPVAKAGYTIKVAITGDAELTQLEIAQPLRPKGRLPRVTDLATGHALAVTDSFQGAQRLAGVRLPITASTQLRFD